MPIVPNSNLSSSIAFPPSIKFGTVGHVSSSPYIDRIVLRTNYGQQLRPPLLPYYHLPTQQPSAAAAPYISIDSILGRGSSMAVLTTVNIPNGGDLFLNASSKISGITTNTPLPPITMDSTINKHQCISIQYH